MNPSRKIKIFLPFSMRNIISGRGRLKTRIHKEVSDVSFKIKEKEECQKQGKKLLT